MKSTTLILFVALLVAPSLALQKGAYNQAALAGASRSPVALGRKTLAPPPVQQEQQKYVEEDDESALLAAQRQRPKPQPPAPTPAPYVPPAPRPQPPAPAPYQPPPQVLAPVRPRPQPVQPAPAPYQPPPQVLAPVRPRPQPVQEQPEGPHPAPEPYSFSYQVNDQESGAALQREESQDANGNVVGFYHITDAEGRLRRVDYTAGPEGFKATIQSNEEGLAARDSADAVFNVQAPSAEKQNAAAAKAQSAAASQGGQGAAPARYALAGKPY